MLLFFKQEADGAKSAVTTVTSRKRAQTEEAAAVEGVAEAATGVMKGTSPVRPQKLQPEAKGFVEDVAVKRTPTGGEMDAESAEKATLSMSVPVQSLEVRVFYC